MGRAFFPFFAFALAALLWAPPFIFAKEKVAKVVPIQKAEEYPSLFREFGGVRLLDTTKPQNGKFVVEAAKVLQSLILPKDGTEDVLFVVLDDMNPNAFYTQVPGTNQKVVGVSLGAVRHFVKNDDQLAALFGHELSHGVSELQEVADDLGASREFRYQAHSKMLQRLVENEVDTRAALERLHPNGWNPNAMTDVLKNIVSVVGDGGGERHTLTSSRIGTTSLSLTAAKRKFGEQILSDEASKYRTAATREMLSYLKSSEFLKAQKAVAEDILKENVPDAFAPLARKFKGGKAGKDADLVLGMYLSDDPYGPITARYWRKIQENLFGLLSPEEETELNLRVHKKVGDAQFAQIQKHFGPPFQPKNPKELQQVLDGIRLYFQPDVAEPTEQVKELANLREERQKILGASGVDPAVRDSQVLALDGKIASAENRMRYVRALYGSDEPIEKYSAAWLKRKNHQSNNDDELMKSVAEFDAAEKEFRAGRRVLSGQEDKFTGLYKDILGRHISLATDMVENYVATNNVRLLADYAAVDPEAAGRAGKVFLERYAQLIKLHKNPSPKDLYDLRVLYSGDAFKSVMGAVAKVDKKAVARFAQAIHPGLMAAQPSMERLLYYHQDLSQIANADDPKRFSWASKVSRHFPSLDAFVRAAKNLVKKGEAGGASYPMRSLEAVLEFMPELDKLGADKSGPATKLKASLAGLFSEALDAEKRKLDPALAAKVSRRQLAALQALTNPKAKDFITHLGYEGMGRADVLAAFDSIDPKVLKAMEIQVRMVDLGEFADAKELYPLAYQKREIVGPGLYGELLPEVKHGVYHPKAYSTVYGYDAWLRANHPGNITERARNTATGHTWELAENKHYFEFIRNLLRERFDLHAKSAPAGDLRARGFQVGLKMNEEFSHWSILNVDHLQKFMEQEVASLKGKGLVGATEFLVGYGKGIRESGKGVGSGVSQFLPFELLKHYLSNPADVDKLGADLAYDLFDLLLWRWSPGAERDAVFERVWKLTENRPDLRKRFLDPKFVKELHYDENRSMIAKWQMESKFDLSKEFAERRGGKTGFRDGQSVRDKVKEVVAHVKEVIADPSPMRDSLLEYAEDRLMTNEAETRLVAEEKALTDLKKAADNPRMLLLEAPMAASKRLKSNQERLNLIEYLIGARDDLGIDPNQYLSPGMADPFHDVNHTLRRKFSELDPNVRTYVINALFENERGIFDEPAVYERMVKRVMGEHADNKLLRNIFDSYIKILPETERKVVMANILSSFSATKKGRVSLGKIFDAMGPFGYMVAQNLRSSDLVKGELVKELDGYFDKADPPKRHVVFGQLKKIFGENLVNVSLNEELGAGSKNYVYLAKLKDPETGSIVTKALRIQRENLEGLIANENGNWTRALAELSAKSDPETKRVAKMLEEVRGTTMASLAPGGAELDQSIERAAFGKAKEIYAKEGRIGVATPDAELLERLVAPEHRKIFSLYDYVDHTPLDKLPKEKSRRLAKEVIEAELSAVFEKGEFDADAHIGNWLYDKSSDKLVRIDYAQLTSLGEAEKSAFRDVFTAMLYPRLGPDQAGVILENLSEVFHVSPPVPAAQMRKTLLAISRESGFPASGTPLDRLLFLRERMEAHLGSGAEVRLKPKVHKAFGLLARIRLFNRFLPAGDFERAVMAHLPKNEIGSLKRAHLKSRVVAAVKGVQSGCSGLFSKLGGLFSKP